MKFWCVSSQWRIANVIGSPFWRWGAVQEGLLWGCSLSVPSSPSLQVTVLQWHSTRSFLISWKESQKPALCYVRVHNHCGHPGQDMLMREESRGEGCLPSAGCPPDEVQKLLMLCTMHCAGRAGNRSKQFKNNIPNQEKCCSLADFSKRFEICFREGSRRAVLGRKFP